MKTPIRLLRKQYQDKYPDNCIRCQFFLNATSYKIPFRKLQNGNRKRVLIICQNPGKEEDRQNSILVGESGKLLMKYVKEYLKGFTVYATNAVKCYSDTVSLQEIRYCKQFLLEDIERIKPDIIIAMGEVARTALKELNYENWKYETCVHPSYVLRGGDDKTIHIAFARAYNTLTDNLYSLKKLSSWDTIVKSNILALDLEWDIKGNIHTVGIANEKLAGAFQLNEVLEKLKTLLESPHNTIIGHSISGDIAKLIKLGIQPKCNFIDTIILSREFGVSETTQDDGLDYFAENYLMMERYWKDIKYPDDFQEYNSKLAHYCASDAYASILLYKRFQEDFKAEWKQMKTAREIDMAMILPVASMELMGIKLDINVYNKHKEKLQQALEKKRQEITTLYGINPGSPQQVLQALREEGYEIATTSAETLTTLNHALAKAVLDYRELHTLVTRYLTEIQVDENHLIHPKYMISKANTGRGATVNPNLQNIPKDLRDMLVSKFDKDGQLVTIDANQSEYRCMAYLSGYKPLIEAYMQGIDMHTWTSELCKIPRKQAKNLNFARLYGASRTRLETMLVKDGLDTKDAKEIVSDYLELTKGLEEYQRRVVDEAMKRGYVESPYGRRGYRLNYTQVINFPVQSFSSDLNKIRLIKLFNLMKSMLSHIWLEFHDGIEIDLWLPEKERLLELVEELPKTIPDVCKKGINLPLPLEIKFHTKGWLDKG